MKTRVIMVGGFLGAGKTTLLYETAKNVIGAILKLKLISKHKKKKLAIVKNESKLRSTINAFKIAKK